MEMISETSTWFFVFNLMGNCVYIGHIHNKQNPNTTIPTIHLLMNQSYWVAMPLRERIATLLHAVEDDSFIRTESKIN